MVDAASKASPASTVTKTLHVRPAARRPRVAASSNETCRGLLSKKTKPAMAAPHARAASSPASVARPQILTMTLIGLPYWHRSRGIVRLYHGHGREVLAGVAGRPRRFQH